MTYSAFRFSLIAGSIFWSLIACSGGGLSIPAGTRCSADYNPIPVPADPSLQKVSLKANDPSPPTGMIALPIGTYTYARADLLFTDSYQDPTTKQQFKIQISNAPDASNVWQKSIGCIRDARAIVTGRSLQATAVTEIHIYDANGTTPTKIATRQVSFRVDPAGLLVYDFSAPSQLVVGSPDAVFAATAKVIQSVMIRNSPTDFEIRSLYQDTQGTYTLSVHLNYTPTP